MNNSEVVKVYGAILSSPGMTDNVKLDLKVNRRTILLLSQVIERGLNGKGDEGSYGMLEALSKDELQGLEAFSKECLEKAGLTELNEKLSALGKAK